jgi:hypothetical protein
LGTPQAPLKDKSLKPRDQGFAGATNTPLAGIFKDMDLQQINHAEGGCGGYFISPVL